MSTRLALRYTPSHLMHSLITALANPRAWPPDMAPVEVIETHISWVLLAGDYAFKIKKPVVLPFVDFGTLAARKHYCGAELRLNRRLAPHIYLDVVPIMGSTEAPRIEGSGTAIEYAVKSDSRPTSRTAPIRPFCAGVSPCARHVAMTHPRRRLPSSSSS